MLSGSNVSSMNYTEVIFFSLILNNQKEKVSFVSYIRTFHHDSFFSSKNGERLIWNDNDEPDMKAVGVDSNSVGDHISTKKVGVTEREIVTDHYKEKEGASNRDNLQSGSIFVLKFLHEFSNYRHHPN